MMTFGKCSKYLETGVSGMCRVGSVLKATSYSNPLLPSPMPGNCKASNSAQLS